MVQIGRRAQNLLRRNPPKGAILIPLGGLRGAQKPRRLPDLVSSAANPPYMTMLGFAELSPTYNLCRLKLSPDFTQAT